MTRMTQEDPKYISLWPWLERVPVLSKALSTHLPPRGMDLKEETLPFLYFFSLLSRIWAAGKKKHPNKVFSRKGMSLAFLPYHNGVTEDPFPENILMSLKKIALEVYNFYPWPINLRAKTTCKCKVFANDTLFFFFSLLTSARVSDVILFLVCWAVRELMGWGKQIGSPWIFLLQKMEKAALVSLHLYVWLFFGVSGDLWNFISLHF